MNDLQKVKQAYLIAARIVAEFGDTYLPMFERLNQELIALEAKSNMMTIAIEAANSSRQK